MGNHPFRTWTIPPKLRRLRDDRGQSLVEFAIVAPFLGALIFGALQFGIAFKDKLALTDGVRAAARAEAVCRFPGNQTPQTAFNNAASDLSSPVTVQFTGSCISGQTVQVSASYPYSVSVPLIGTLLSGNLTSTVSERIE